MKNLKLQLKTLCILSLLLTSCEDKQNNITGKEQLPDKSVDLDSWIKRQVESKLKINAAENYTLTIHEEYLDRDTLIDAVILVNREEYAKKKAAEDGDTSFEDLIGHTGPYNHVFTYINGSKKLHQAPPVGSSAEQPLTIQFETISNPSQKDFYVEYRVRSSINRNYYTLDKGKVILTFSCPLYDFMDPQEPRIYSIKHLESDVRIGKDIALYKGNIKNYAAENIEDFYSYYPEEVVATDDLYVFFIYDKKRMKYVTPMSPEE